MTPSSMNDLFTFITQLMTEHAGMFEAMGLNMYRGFVVILLAWFGAKSALGSASGGTGPYTFSVATGFNDSRTSGNEILRSSAWASLALIALAI